jgi:hypothetical protein
VVLDDKNRATLLQRVPVPTGDGWETIAHHLTICMGPIKDRTLVGQRVLLKVVAMDRDEKVMAVKIETPDIITFKEGAIPHITMAVNKLMDGKPVHSRDLENWIPISNFYLEGTITEVTR